MSLEADGLRVGFGGEAASGPQASDGPLSADSLIRTSRFAPNRHSAKRHGAFGCVAVRMDLSAYWGRHKSIFRSVCIIPGGGEVVIPGGGEVVGAGVRRLRHFIDTGGNASTRLERMSWSAENGR